MNTFLLSAIVTGLYVSLRTFQQINVIHRKYWRVFPTSLAMGVGDVLLILMIVRADTWLIGLTNGLGGALGCYGAMWLHKRMG